MQMSLTTGQVMYLSLQTVLSLRGLRHIASIGWRQRTVWIRKKVCCL